MGWSPQCPMPHLRAARVLLCGAGGAHTHTHVCVCVCACACRSAASVAECRHTDATLTCGLRTPIMLHLRQHLPPLRTQWPAATSTTTVVDPQHTARGVPAVVDANDDAGGAAPPNVGHPKPTPGGVHDVTHVLGAPTLGWQAVPPAHTHEGRHGAHPRRARTSTRARRWLHIIGVEAHMGWAGPGCAAAPAHTRPHHPLTAARRGARTLHCPPPHACSRGTAAHDPGGPAHTGHGVWRWRGGLRKHMRSPPRRVRPPR